MILVYWCCRVLKKTNKLFFFRLKNYIKTTMNLLLRKRLFIASVFAHSVPRLTQWSTDKEKLCKINSWKCFNLDHDFDKNSNITSPLCWTVVLCRSSASVITRVVYWAQLIPSFSGSYEWLVGPPWRPFWVTRLKRHVHVALDNCRSHCHKVNGNIQHTSNLEEQGNV